MKGTEKQRHKNDFFVIFVSFVVYLGRGEHFKNESAVSRGIPLATALQVACARAAVSWSAGASVLSGAPGRI
ncbi:MAG: hypothetical protein FJ222_00700 [Lentisphaerae bacterium]|nr:hypothetical protein [Lentisphaerota bacterium]